MRVRSKKVRGGDWRRGHSLAWDLKEILYVKEKVGRFAGGDMNMESEETSGLNDVLTLRSCGTRQNQETD